MNKNLGLFILFLNFWVQALFSQISVSGSFSEPCKPGGSANLKILVKKYDLKDFLLLQIETPSDFFIQSKSINGGNFVNSGKKYAIEWAEDAFPKEREFEITFNVLAPDILPESEIEFTTKVAFMLGENEKNESLAPIKWAKIASAPITNLTSTNSTTVSEPTTQNTITEISLSSNETASTSNPDTLMSDSLSKVVENKKRQNFDLDSLKQYGIGDKIEIVVQQMTQLKIDAKEVRKVGEVEFRSAKTATEKETAERILKIAVDMETEALELERILANVTYTYNDDVTLKSSKSSVSVKKPKPVNYTDNLNNASSNSKNLSNAGENYKNIDKKPKPLNYTDNRNNASSNYNDLSNAADNNKNTEPKKQNTKKRKIVAEEVDSIAKSIIDENQPYFRVQIGAFRNKPSQIPYKNKIKNWQLLCDANGIYRVQVGVYKTKQEALEYQSKLKSLGVSQSFVVKILK